MPVRLNRNSADFDQRFAAFLATKREVSADVDAAVARHRAGCRGPGRRGADRGYREVRPASSSTPAIFARRRSRDRRRGSDCDEQDAGCAEIRPRPDRAVSPAADCRRTSASPMRCGVELGWRWSAVEVGRPLCSGRHGEPIHRSVLMNAVPAKVAGVARLVMVVPAPDGETQSAGAGRGAARRRERDLSRRRRAGGRGARLWHRDDRAGRQDRRARQRLCRGRQAAGVRQGRHRHDRRPVRGAGRRRRHRQCQTGSRPICWRRPSTTNAPSRS